MTGKVRHSLKTGAIVLLAVLACGVTVVATVQACNWVGRPFPGFVLGKALNVYPLTAPHWEYHSLGLQERDKLVAVNGKPLANHRQFLAWLAGRTPGEQVAYSFLRDGKPLEVQGTIRRFGYSDLFYVFVIPLISGILFLVIGIVVFFLKSRSAAAAIFAVFCCMIGLYFVCLFQYYFGSSLRLVSDLVSNTIPAVFLHLALVFPNKRGFYRKRPGLMALPYVLLLVFYLIKRDAQTVHYALFVTLDRVLDWMIVVAYLGLLARLIYSSHWEKSALLRRRAQVALMGMLLAFLVPAVVLALSASRGISSINLPFAFTVIFPLYLGYAIVRHNLFDSQRVIVNSVFYTLFILLGIGLFFLLSAITGYFVGMREASRHFLAPLLVILIMTLSLSFLRRVFQQTVERFFLRKKAQPALPYPGREQSLLALLRFSENTEQVLGRLLEEMGVLNAAVLFYEEGRVDLETFLDFGMGTEDKHFLFHTASREFLTLGNDILIRADLERLALPPENETDIGRIFEETTTCFILPVYLDGRMTGLFLVGEKATGEPYDGDELALLRELSGHLAIARENTRLLERTRQQERLEQELRIASEIQRSFLPREPETAMEYELAYHYRPARHVGGDIFDFFQEDGKLGMLIGDVSGKGVAAALFGAVSSGLIKANWGRRGSLSRFLEELNTYLLQIHFRNLNLAMGCGEFDFRDRELHFANAGLPYPLHMDGRSGNMRQVEAVGLPLGVLEEVHYKEISVPFQEGDVFFFYSDGIVELENNAGEMYGFNRFQTLAQSCPGCRPREILAAILQDLYAFSSRGTEVDDQTLIVVRVSETQER